MKCEACHKREAEFEALTKIDGRPAFLLQLCLECANRWKRTRPSKVEVEEVINNVI